MKTDLFLSVSIRVYLWFKTRWVVAETTTHGKHRGWEKN